MLGELGFVGPVSTDYLGSETRSAQEFESSPTTKSRTIEAKLE